MKAWLFDLKIWIKSNVATLIGIGILILIFTGLVYLENKQLVDKALMNDDLMPWYITYGKSLIGLLLYGYLIKIFFVTKPFVETIGTLFENIFINLNFIKTLKDKQRLEIAEQINKADDNITLIDKRIELDSIHEVEQHWYNERNDNFIIENSEYVYSIYKCGREIIYKKITFKIMEDGKFKYIYKFRPFYTDNLEEKTEKYKTNNPGNRWENEAFKWEAPILNEIPVKVDLKYEPASEESKDWIVLSCTHRKLLKGQQFDIEFSIAHDFGLENNEEEVKRRQEYFQTTYRRPHAKRKITFQVESYNGEFTPYIVPIMTKINGSIEEDIIVHPKQTIYYKSWTWELFYSETKDKEIRFSVEI